MRGSSIPQLNNQYSIYTAYDAFQKNDFLLSKKILDKLINTKRSDFSITHLYGLVLWELGKKTEAAKYLKAAHILSPRDYSCIYNLGCLYLELENYREAVLNLSNALRLQPNSSECLLSLGNTFRFSGEFHRAISCYKKAIEIKPDYFEAWSNLGLIYSILEKYEEATEFYLKAISINSGSATLFSNIATCYRMVKNYEKALLCCKRALDIDPTFSGALLNEINILIDQKDYGNALSIIEEAETQGPLTNEFLNLKADILLFQGKVDEALCGYENVLKIDPDNAHAHSKLAPNYLSRGNFELGWNSYEYRHLSDEFLIRAASTQVFENLILKKPEVKDILNKDVYLISEQGIGDQVLFLSTLPDLLKLARTVVCQVDSRLIKLFTFNFPNIKFLPKESLIPTSTINRYVFLRHGSLPYLFCSKETDFSGQPYLKVNNLDYELIPQKSEISDRIRIGLSWRGGIKQEDADRRSLKLDDFKSLLENPKFEIYSIQHGDVSEEIQLINSRSSKKIGCFQAGELTDIYDLSRAIWSFDIVISVDNTNVMLAGALGKKCICILGEKPNWRYQKDLKYFKWFNSVELIRSVEFLKSNTLLFQA